MIDKKELITILEEDNKNTPLCKKVNDKVFLLSSGEDITDQMFPHLLKSGEYGYRKDGVYRLSAATCGGSCEINKPAVKCVNNGMYSVRKCSKYSLFSANGSYNIDAEKLLSRLEEDR